EKSAWTAPLSGSVNPDLFPRNATISVKPCQHLRGRGRRVTTKRAPQTEPPLNRKAGFYVPQLENRGGLRNPPLRQPDLLAHRAVGALPEPRPRAVRRPVRRRGRLDRLWLRRLARAGPRPHGPLLRYSHPRHHPLPHRRRRPARPDQRT